MEGEVAVMEIEIRMVGRRRPVSDRVGLRMWRSVPVASLDKQPFLAVRGDDALAIECLYAYRRRCRMVDWRPWMSSDEQPFRWWPVFFLEGNMQVVRILCECCGYEKFEKILIGSRPKRPHPETEELVAQDPSGIVSEGIGFVPSRTSNGWLTASRQPGTLILIPPNERNVAPSSAAVIKRYGNTFGHEILQLPSGTNGRLTVIARYI